MRITLSSLMVDDQDKALAFYTDKLGFHKKNDIPMGPYRWLTVVSPEGVHFHGKPVVMGPITAVVFEDGCGNLINLHQL